MGSYGLWAENACVSVCVCAPFSVLGGHDFYHCPYPRPIYRTPGASVHVLSTPDVLWSSCGPRPVELRRERGGRLQGVSARTSLQQPFDLCSSSPESTTKPPRLHPVLRLNNSPKHCGRPCFFARVFPAKALHHGGHWRIHRGDGHAW